MTEAELLLDGAIGGEVLGDSDPRFAIAARGCEKPFLVLALKSRGLRQIDGANARRRQVFGAGSWRKPPPQRLTWPTEGEGKCIVQHRVGVSQ